MKYRQTKVAYVVKYVIYKWFLAMMTFGLVAVYDFYKYKRNSLTLVEKAIKLEYGVITQNSREVLYKNIQSVTVNQSVIGQMFNYGHIVITTANQSDAIMFKYVDKPELLRQAIQDQLT